MAIHRIYHLTKNGGIGEMWGTLPAWQIAMSDFQAYSKRLGLVVLPVVIPDFSDF